MAQLTRRGFMKLAALTAIGGMSALEACSRGPRQKAVNFFNWVAYIGKKTISNFESETGIKVNYEVYSSEEEMFSKLKAGVHGYDLMVTSDFILPRLKALNMIDPIPKDLLANLGNLDSKFRDPFYDPGLAYTIPYLWGTTGIGFNTVQFAKPPSSWWTLWDGKYKGRIDMLDNPRDSIGTALLLLGFSSESKDPAQLAKARDLLLKQRPLLKQYSSSTYIDDLASGEIWLAEGWNGDVLQAARERKQIDYVIPKEGSFMYVDSLHLMRGATRKQEVLRFVDYLLRPEVAAEIANTVRYATPNAKAMALLDPAMRDDPRVFPSKTVQRRLQFHVPLDPEADELWNKTWQEVKVL